VTLKGKTQKYGHTSTGAKAEVHTKWHFWPCIFMFVLLKIALIWW